MADNQANLSIGVGLDLAKLRADAIMAQAEVRTLGRDVNRAAGQGDAATVAALTPALINAEKQSAALKAQWIAQNVEAKSFKDHLIQIGEHMERIRGRIPLGGFEGMSGGLLTNIPLTGSALGIGAAVGALAGLGKVAIDAAESAHEIESLAAQLGISTGQMRALEVAAGGAGVKLELFHRVLERFDIAAEKAAVKQRDLAIDAAVATADADAIVARGGRSDKPHRATAHAVEPSLMPSLDEIAFFAAQQLNLRKDNNLQRVRVGQQPIPLPDLDTYKYQLRAQAGEDTKAGEELRKNIRERGGNVPFASEKEGLENLKGKGDDAFQTLNVRVTDFNNNLRPTPELLLAFNKALREAPTGQGNAALQKVGGRGAYDTLLNAFFKSEELGKALGVAPSSDKKIEEGAEAAKHINQLEAKALDEMRQFGLNEISVLHSAITTFRGVIDTVSGNLSPELSGAADRAAKALDGIKGVNAGAGASPFAEGGMIRGPGTATSDSIPILASNGEFVVNARATSNNLSLLHAINDGYAMGGVVGFPSLPRFAEGGEVGGRAPVNLHLGGNSYALHGSEGVVDALVAEAHRQNMTSAGVKPSWYAGRPSGR